MTFLLFHHNLRLATREVNWPGTAAECCWHLAG
jgi:hypothetical protein